MDALSLSGGQEETYDDAATLCNWKAQVNGHGGPHDG